VLVKVRDVGKLNVGLTELGVRLLASDLFLKFSLHHQQSRRLQYAIC
jgi:hypothetical protein